MEDIKLIRLEQTDSTNRFLREYTGEEGRRITVATAEYQTSGHGQGSNSWESERGKNLLFSMMLRPKNFPAPRQFSVIEAGALAVGSVFNDIVDDVAIKWPNDIYWQDRKLAGILSECEVRGGMITRCIAGIGINIGQTEFRSDAPNPVSLFQIKDQPFGMDMLDDAKNFILENVIHNFMNYMFRICESKSEKIHDLYLESLYRNDDIYEFEDKGGCFFASIGTVEPDGRLVLKREDGSISKYAFKEVRYIIN